jgi:AcrR family transcriptional regulator
MTRARPQPSRTVLLDRGRVTDIQRARLIMAMAQLARERGVATTTVSDVVACSGVSRRTFYELFDGLEDCFQAAFELAVERAARRALPAYESAGGWRERIRAGLGALLEFLDDEPDFGALCVVDVLAAGPSVLERRAQVMRTLIDAVDEGRGEAPASAQLTRLTAEGVVGAVSSVLHARLSARPKTASRGGGADAEPTVTLLGGLMAIVVLPYLGRGAAVREAARPAPSHQRAAPSRPQLPRNLGMRLTYRTVQVLLAIAASPSASNRQIADAAGIADQGQISKLLARLEHLGLIRNEIAGPYRGEPNSWSLTARGEELERTILCQGAPCEDRHELAPATGGRKRKAGVG